MYGYFVQLTLSYKGTTLGGMVKALAADLEDIVIPAKYDPEKHCGAKLRKRRTLCLQPKGFKTNHVGIGKCYLHGGATPIKHGAYSTVNKERASVMAEAARLENDPSLLSLDSNIAFLKALWNRYQEQLADQFDSLDSLTTRLEEIGGEDGEIDPETLRTLMPKVDLTILDQLRQMIKTAHDMRYNKRTMVPIAELVSLLNEMGKAFDEICVQYNIPLEARQKFAAAVRKLRQSKPDAMLDHVERPAMQSPVIIEAAGGR